MPDVVPFTTLTPGVTRFYRSCLAAGTQRSDGAVVCPSQKELALLLRMSQGTIASHLSSLGHLVLQRSPVVILTSAGPSLPFPEDPGPMGFEYTREQAIRSLGRMIASFPSSAALPFVAETLKVLAVERETGRDQVANDRDIVAVNTDSDQDSVTQKVFPSISKISLGSSQSGRVIALSREKSRRRRSPWSFFRYPPSLGAGGLRSLGRRGRRRRGRGRNKKGVPETRSKPEAQATMRKVLSCADGTRRIQAHCSVG